MGEKLVGLVRVSTDRQGESGLGLEAQHATIEAHRESIGGELLKTYEEIESGTHDDVEARPDLLKAVAHARRAGATLVIAKGPSKNKFQVSLDPCQFSSSLCRGLMV
jgi:DNA invertase Pin-like site-specific DNA recombinase